MSSHIWKAIRDWSQYALEVGDEFEVRFPEDEGDLITMHVHSRHEIRITQEILESLGKPFRLG